MLFQKFCYYHWDTTFKKQKIVCRIRRPKNFFSRFTWLIFLLTRTIFQKIFGFLRIKNENLKKHRMWSRKYQSLYTWLIKSAAEARFLPKLRCYDYVESLNSHVSTNYYTGCPMSRPQYTNGRWYSSGTSKNDSTIYRVIHLKCPTPQNLTNKNS